MTKEPRSLVQQLAKKSLENDDPTGWFEELYQTAEGDESAIPWADLQVNPNFDSWIKNRQLEGRGKTALVVGCGLGDDAETLAQLGFAVVAFDISPTAISWCKKRFPNSQVNYLVDDLLQPDKILNRRFDFVLESYTLQALPARVRPQAMSAIVRLMAENGTLLVICRGRNSNEPAPEIPFPLTKEELNYFKKLGLEQIEMEDYIEAKAIGVRRFRIEYRLKVT